jgi:hypothetical protein
MNAFRDASKVEAKGMAVLLPFLEEKAGRGLVLTSKGTLAKHLQLIAGDVLYNDFNDRMWAVEIKCEEQDKYGNLFLETWSNRNLDSKGGHAERGSNQGWLYHCRADVLLYYFLESDELYVLNLFKLKQWAFGFASVPGKIYAYAEKVQEKRTQLNDTWGRCVPIRVLQESLGASMRKCNPLGLLMENIEVAA